MMQNPTWFQQDLLNVTVLATGFSTEFFIERVLLAEAQALNQEK